MREDSLTLLAFGNAPLRRADYLRQSEPMSFETAPLSETESGFCQLLEQWPERRLWRTK